MKARVAVFAVGLTVLIATWQLWPSDERRIKRLVAEMGAVFDGRPLGADLEIASRLAPLARALAPGVVVDGVAAGGVTEAASIEGRDAVLGAALAALRLRPDLQVSVRGVEVMVMPGAAVATAIAGVVVAGDSAHDFAWRDVSELRFELARDNDIWLVTRVSPELPLRP